MCHHLRVDVQRETVTGPSGITYVVRAAAVGGIDTGDVGRSRLVVTRRLAMYVQLFGWLRNRVRHGGKWAVMAGVAGSAGTPPRLVYSTSVADRDAALREVNILVRKIGIGEIG